MSQSPTRFPFDLGRGIPEEFTYWPDKKLLQLPWKNPDGSTRDLNITPDNLGVDTLHQHLWEITAEHREWLDRDHAGEQLPPESAPPGILDNRIAVVPGQEPSVQGAAPQQQQQPSPDQHGMGQQVNTDMLDFPTIVVDLETWANMKALIEMDAIVIESLTAYLEDTVEDKASKKIIDVLVGRNQKMRGKYLGEFAESD